MIIDFSKNGVYRLEQPCLFVEIFLSFFLFKFKALKASHRGVGPVEDEI